MPKCKRKSDVTDAKLKICFFLKLHLSKILSRSMTDTSGFYIQNHSNDLSKITSSCKKDLFQRVPMQFLGPPPNGK